MNNFSKLSRSEMKNVVGGVMAAGNCAVSCNGFYSSKTYSTLSAAKTSADENVTSGRCSKATYCCDNCPSYVQ